MTDDTNEDKTNSLSLINEAIDHVGLLTSDRNPGDVQIALKSDRGVRNLRRAPNGSNAANPTINASRALYSTIQFNRRIHRKSKREPRCIQ